MNQRGQLQGRTRPPAVQYLRTKLVIWLLLCALPGIGAVTMWLKGVSVLPAAIYLAMSLLTFFLYWRDKRQAQGSGWRTPEKILHGAEFLGGWPGAFVAQQVLRHKTRKVSYQLVFWLIVLLHELVWFDRVLLGGNFLARHFY